MVRAGSAEGQPPWGETASVANVCTASDFCAETNRLASGLALESPAGPARGALPADRCDRRPPSKNEHSRTWRTCLWLARRASRTRRRRKDSAPSVRHRHRGYRWLVWYDGSRLIQASRRVLYEPPYLAGLFTRCLRALATLRSKSVRLSAIAVETAQRMGRLAAVAVFVTRRHWHRHSLSGHGRSKASLTLALRVDGIGLRPITARRLRGAGKPPSRCHSEAYRGR